MSEDYRPIDGNGHMPDSEFGQAIGELYAMAAVANRHRTTDLEPFAHSAEWQAGYVQGQLDLLVRILAKSVSDFQAAVERLEARRAA